MIALCRRIAGAQWFEVLTLCVILLNAALLGLDTYPAIEREAGHAAGVISDVLLGYFTLEILIRILAHGRRPQDYFRSGWNVFDFVVIGAAYLPGVRENATVLRLVRLLRVFRVFSLLPELRVLVSGMVRSFRPLGSLALLFVLVLYVYAMLGWILFRSIDPEHWRNIGRAMLTMFQLLTIEGWNDIQDAVLPEEPSSWIFFVSFIVLSAFVLFNIVIGVVINSIEEARDEARAEALALERALHAEGATAESQVLQRLDALQEAIEDLRADLESNDGASASARPPAGARTTKRGTSSP
jgi:voltage-gated sodium channel